MYRIQQRNQSFFAELCAFCYELLVKHRKDDITLFKSNHFGQCIQLTSRIRDIVFETMDAQMADGFGEVLSHRPIANTEHAYYEI